MGNDNQTEGKDSEQSRGQELIKKKGGKKEWRVGEKISSKHRGSTFNQ